MTVGDAELKNVAYWRSPSWSRRDGERLKTLLLFFDGIAVLAGEGFEAEAVERDPVLAGPLADRGLLHVLDAESLIDGQMAADLREIVDRTIQGRDRRAITLNRTNRFDSGHMGLDWGLENWLPISSTRAGKVYRATGKPSALDHLIDHGLAFDTDSGAFVEGWAYDLLMLALQQLVRRPAENLGLALQPVEQSPASWMALRDALTRVGADEQLSQAAVVGHDLDVVTLNLASVPLDEVLGFREQHGPAFRAYARNLRALVRDLGATDAADQASVLADRREALADAAHELRRTARQAWRRPMASFSLGIAGVAVALSVGNLPGAAIAAAGGLLGIKRQADPGTAYAYLFNAERDLAAYPSKDSLEFWYRGR